MDFKDQIKQLSERISKVKDQIQTEEGTKNAFIMPFIQILGYDVFDPTEVVPEMDCDIAKKKGEKIDYAIQKDGETIILIECKHWQQNLNLHDTQLQRYFVASNAKFGVLTNGIEYRFYSDLNKPNIMDSSPFLVVNMEKLRDAQIEELKKFHKSYFDLDNILSSASELKYMSELKAQIKGEFDNPSPDLVRLLAKRVYDGVITQKVLDVFIDLVKRSVSGYITDVMSDRLNIAIKSTENDSSPKQEEALVKEQVVDEENQQQKIVTTDEEIEGYYIVKSILRSKIHADRIFYRDAQTYCAINIDNNNKKTICRLYFNTSNKQIGIIGSDKIEVKHKIESLDEIYDYQDELLSGIEKYLE